MCTELMSAERNSLPLEARDYLGDYPWFQDVLLKNVKNVTPGCTRREQQPGVMNGDHCAQHGLTIGYISYVLLVLSNHPSFLS